MNTLRNLSFCSPGEREAAISSEFSPLRIDSRYPDWQNQLGEPAPPITIELPSRRTYGVTGFCSGKAWFFRFDTSYTVVTDIALLQHQVDALEVLSRGDLIISTAVQVGNRQARLIKFNNHNSLHLLTLVLQDEAARLYASYQAEGRPLSMPEQPHFLIMAQLAQASRRLDDTQ